MELLYIITNEIANEIANGVINYTKIKIQYHIIQINELMVIIFKIQMIYHCD